METPNQPNTTTGSPTTAETSTSGLTAEQAEFRAGEAVAGTGKELPDGASEAAKEGYENVDPKPDVEDTLPQGVDVTENEIITHRVAPQAQTDRPTPSVSQNDALPLNPNENVKVKVDPEALGQRYTIEGLEGGGTATIDFADVTEEALIAVIMHRLDQPDRASVYTRNASRDLESALNWFKIATRENLKRHGVTAV